MRVVHLPVYAENAYQPLLMEALRTRDVIAINGGGGGNFCRTALFKWRADILHFHWLHPYLLRNGRLRSIARAARFLCEVNALKLSGSRIVWTIHNLSNHDRQHTSLERFFSTRFGRHVDGIIVHSEAALSAAESAFRLRNELVKAVIPQASYVGHYPNTISKTESRIKLGMVNDGFVFVFLGRIEPYKCVLELIHAFRQMYDDVHLLVAGRVSQPDSLKLIQAAMEGAANIRFENGFVPDDRIQIYLNAADAYVYPVRDVLNSGSIPLAMSFGLPCIAPDLPGVVDALGVTGGILYNPKQPEGLLRAMQQALNRKRELIQIGASNLERAREWTWGKVADRTREVYDRCLER
jgi:beta-1,4-mannosyltransferase